MQGDGDMPNVTASPAHVRGLVWTNVVLVGVEPPLRQLRNLMGHQTPVCIVLGSKWDRKNCLGQGKAFLTCVGVMWLMSSDASCFRSVVLPALSSPKRRSRTSCSGVLFSLRRIESKP